MLFPFFVSAVPSSVKLLFFSKFLPSFPSFVFVSIIFNIFRSFSILIDFRLIICSSPPPIFHSIFLRFCPVFFFFFSSVLRAFYTYEVRYNVRMRGLYTFVLDLLVEHLPQAQRYQPCTKQQRMCVPIRARERKEPDRVGESQHVENVELQFF